MNVDLSDDPEWKVATEKQAEAAYYQFSWEPHPEGYTEQYPDWNDLDDAHKQLWFRVATAVLNGRPVNTTPEWNPQRRTNKL